MRRREAVEKIWENPYVLTSNIGIICMYDENKQKVAYRVWLEGEAGKAVLDFMKRLLEITISNLTRLSAWGHRNTCHRLPAMTQNMSTFTPAKWSWVFSTQFRLQCEQFKALMTPPCAVEPWNILHSTVFNGSARKSTANLELSVFSGLFMWLRMQRKRASLSTSMTISIYMMIHDIYPKNIGDMPLELIYMASVQLLLPHSNLYTS